MQPHGSRTRYQGSAGTPPCHCDVCRAGNAAYSRSLRSAVARARAMREAGREAPRTP